MQSPFFVHGSGLELNFLHVNWEFSLPAMDFKAQLAAIIKKVSGKVPGDIYRAFNMP